MKEFKCPLSFSSSIVLGHVKYKKGSHFEGKWKPKRNFPHIKESINPKREDFSLLPSPSYARILDLTWSSKLILKVIPQRLALPVINSRDEKWGLESLSVQVTGNKG